MVYAFVEAISLHSSTVEFLVKNYITHNSAKIKTRKMWQKNSLVTLMKHCVWHRVRLCQKKVKRMFYLYSMNVCSMKAIWTCYICHVVTVMWPIASDTLFPYYMVVKYEYLDAAQVFRCTIRRWLCMHQCLVTVFECIWPCNSMKDLKLCSAVSVRYCFLFSPGSFREMFSWGFSMLHICQL